MRSHCIAVAALVLVTAVIYAPLRTASYVYEDANAVWANASVTGGAPVAIDRARWLSALSHRLVFEAFGHSAQAPHVVNVCLHLLNGVLAFGLLASVLPAWPAVLACGVFLLHPLQTEAVAYVASRSELLSTCFALVACLITIHARRWWHHGAVWGCVALAISAKESTVVIIPILIGLTVLQGARLSPWRIAALVVPALLMAVSVFLFDFVHRSELGPWSFAAAQATAFWRYVAMVVVPVGQTIDHDFDLVPFTVRWVALGGLVAALVAVWWLPRAIALGVVWVVLTLSPRFVMRIPELLNEHQMYLPMVGLSLIVAWTVCALETAYARAVERVA